MPDNTQMEGCFAQDRGVLVCWSPEEAGRRPGARVQIIDVFALALASGYGRDAQGQLRLEAQASMAAGCSWSVAQAAQLIRNDVQPHRWVALHSTAVPGACSGPAAARHEPWRLVAWTSLIWAVLKGATINTESCSGVGPREGLRGRRSKDRLCTRFPYWRQRPDLSSLGKAL